MEDHRDLAFSGVLAGKSAEKRTALIVFPAAVVLALVIGFAVVAISKMSGLSTQVQMAKAQLEESNKVVEERDKQLRDARAETAVLAQAGQGASVLTAAAGGGSGVAIVHPEQHALNVYAWNLAAAPEGREYRAIVSDAGGAERDAGALAPDDRGAAFLIARNLPEGLSRIEVALVPRAAPGKADAKPDAAKDGAKEGAAKDPAAKDPAPGADARAAAAPAALPPASERQTVLAGSLPRPGEAGVVSDAPKAPRVQARRGR